jgi:hypothetical protein
MQRYFAFMNSVVLEPECPDETKTVRKKRVTAGWDDGHEIIPYRHPGSDKFDNEIFAWEMITGKDGIIRKPVKVINPPDDEWQEYP